MKDDVRFGKGEASEILENILSDLDDKKLTNRTGSIYNDYCSGLVNIEKLSSKSYRDRYALLWRKEFIKIINEESNFPEAVRTHLLNVITVRYRETLRK